MNGQVILLVVLGLALCVLVAAWPMVVRRTVRGLENLTAARRARRELEAGSPGEVLAEVDSRIAEQQALVDKYERAGAAAIAEGAAEPLRQARRELLALREYRERLVREARQRGLDVAED